MSNLYTQIDMLRKERDEARGECDKLRKAALRLAEALQNEEVLHSSFDENGDLPDDCNDGDCQCELVLLINSLGEDS